MTQATKAKPNGSKPSGAVTTVVVDSTTYPTRSEVANRTGVSVSTIRKWERTGRLHAFVDAEGTHRFHPDEVDAICEAVGDEDLVGERSDAYAQMELRVVNRLLGLMTTPRERIDKLMLGMLERLDKRNETLENKLVEVLEAREKYYDRSAERDIAKTKAEAEEHRFTMLFEQLGQHLEGFMNRKGTPFLYSLDLDKLEELRALGASYWGEAQLKAIDAAIATKKDQTITVTPDAGTETQEKEKDGET